jgi:aspartyl aminopeptidase
VHDQVRDLLTFIDRSPTPYHAVAEGVRRLETAGFQPVSETDVWSLSPGARRYIVRHDGSLVAFEVGSAPPAEAGFRMIGAHTDSPNLRLKPRADVKAHGYRQLAVETYGGVLLHTWLDRDLSLAGRVTFREGDAVRTELVDLERPLLRVPSLAIHLNREVNTAGLQLNPQQHLVPILGLEDGPALTALVVEELAARAVARVEADAVLAFDLMCYDVQPSGVGGARGEFVVAPRLDNLASCHAAIAALLEAGREPTPPFTRVVVLYDHEEIGSRSAQGAAGPFLLTWRTPFTRTTRTSTTRVTGRSSDVDRRSR